MRQLCVHWNMKHLGSLESTQELLLATPQATLMHLSYTPNSHMLHISMITCWHMNQLLPKKKKTFFSSSCPLETLFTVCSVFCWWKDDYFMFDTILNKFFFIRLIVFLFCFSLLVTSLAKIGLQASLVACCVFTIWHLSVISISFHLTISPLNHSCKSWE